MTHSAQKTEARAFLASHKTGVLSTISKDQRPRGRLVYFASDDEFTIYFMTLATTRKMEDLTSYPLAAFTVSDESTFQTLQMEGTVVDITNSPTDDTIIESLFHRLQVEAGHYPPLAHLDRGDVKFFRIDPEWIRWGDFEGGFKSKDVLFELSS